MVKSKGTKGLEDLGIRTPAKELNYLSAPRQFDLPKDTGDLDRKGWSEVMKAFEGVNLLPNEIESIPRILASILLLGEIEVLQSEKDTEGRVVLSGSGETKEKGGSGSRGGQK